MAQENLLETTPIINGILSPFDFNHAVVGGLVTDALLSEGAVIDPENKLIHVDDRTIVPVRRPNGTARDIDILAFTEDRAKTAQGVDELSVAITDRFSGVSVSLSGYDTAHGTGVGQFVSRTVSTGCSTLTLSLGDVRQEVPRWHLEDTWRLDYRGLFLHTLHPVAHLMSYKTRSITGIRPKDAGKVLRLESTINEQMPLEDVLGFDVWEEFALAIETYYSLGASLRSLSTRRTATSLGRYGLGLVEKRPRFVAIAQNNEGRIGKMAQRVLSHSKPGLQTK